MKKPLLKYFGSKWRLAPLIVENMPPHELYVEPFVGSGAVLFRKPRSKKELINDLDGDMVNLFLVIQNPDTCAQLVKLCKRTPYSREIYNEVQEMAARKIQHTDHVTRALMTVVRSMMAVHPDALHTPTVGFSSRIHMHPTSGAWRPREWMNYPRVLASIRQRLQGVLIEQKDALEVIKDQDREDTCFYCDPPYMPEVRQAGEYREEMSEADHVKLLECLKNVRGRVILSGYSCPLYEEALSGWKRVTKREQAAMGRKTEEVLWIK